MKPSPHNPARRRHLVQLARLGTAALAGVAPARLESLGLSASRSLALRRAAAEVSSGRVDLRASDHERGWTRLRAIPGIGCDVPIWLLGSSLYSAQVAAHLGYPFAFASHFAPAMLMQALQIYRARFRPNGQPGALTKPHAMVAVNVICADTDDEAAYLFTSLQQRFLGMQTGKRGPLPKPIRVADMNALGSPAERADASRRTNHHRRRAPPRGADVEL